MVKYLTLVTGDYQENCYIVYTENSALVIDPGDEFELIDESLIENGINPSAILLTHGHFDHVGAVNKLKSKYNCKVYMHSDDNNLLTFMRTKDFDIDIDVKNENTISVGDINIECVKTPGHSEGSVCYKIDKLLFSGDTLFKESIGRCDLPGGSTYVMMKTLSSVIMNLSDDLVVLPGHGEKTTIFEEKANNYYLKNLLQKF